MDIHHIKGCTTAFDIHSTKLKLPNSFWCGTSNAQVTKIHCASEIHTAGM
jgi:hypothetical protein